MSIYTVLSFSPICTRCQGSNLRLGERNGLVEQSYGLNIAKTPKILNGDLRQTMTILSFDYKPCGTFDTLCRHLLVFPCVIRLHNSESCIRQKCEKEPGVTTKKYTQENLAASKNGIRIMT